MEDLRTDNARLKAALDSHVRSLNDALGKLDAMESSLKEKQEALAANKKLLDRIHANPDAADSDLVEINAGGMILALRRSTLTRIKGTRFEALFSGRWDKKLQKDSKGRIFLDVNPVCFQAIVDHLSELDIASAENPASPPCVSDEYKHILRQHLELFGLFGLFGKVPIVELPDSNIITKDKDAEHLHEWLEEGGSGGQLELLYRGSRDGLSNDTFHSSCDGRGCTLTVIETTEGYVLGGYSNTPWSSNRGYRQANKAFLFVLYGRDISSPCKMKLKRTDFIGLNRTAAVYHAAAYGPCFGLGHGLEVDGTKVLVESSGTYAPWPAGELSKKDASFTIKEIEVFRVSSGETTLLLTKGVPDVERELPQVEAFTQFTEDINEALTAKQDCLLQSELDLLRLEDAFEDERNFINAFAGGDAEDVIALNVNGKMMAVHRATLQAIEDSVLARQFDASMWTEQGIGPRVKTWTPDDVASWADNIDGIPGDVANIFKESEINGTALLVLGVNGLKMIGIKNAGTVCLILDGVQKLQNVTLIEHSPYCFGKIVDFLRQKRLRSLGLAEEPALPEICDEQKSRFENVVRFYFPGDSANLLLGDATSAPTHAKKRRKTSEET